MKIAIIGALWTSNFGDVLLAKLLKDKLVMLGHSVIMPNASNSVKNEAGLEEEKFKISESDCILFCGGGYFSEPPGNSFKWAISRYKSLFKYATYCKIKKIPYSIIGVGAGPINSFVARKVISHVCSGAENILLRDNESIKAIKNLNQNYNLIEVSDLVLSINDIYELGPVYNSVDKIGVHLTLNGREQIKPILKYVKENKNSYDFYLIEDNPGEYDRLCYEYTDIKELFADKYITYKSIDEFVSQIHSFDMVITSKLHVGIVAAALNKKVCSLPYHAKVKRLYDEFDRSDVVLEDFHNPSRIYAHVSNCYESEPITIPSKMLEKSRKINMFIEEKFGEKK
ncbi:polysaccharide pyruvyl transferase family protein [Salinivibrio sp. KP-1]|uniref:polysaccharide pyruvyl transferase family protein n=1 Tax=Salinivibrio sp. KP-1 TaxID=1406902 RepID=UPI0006144F83|nr:polysaccharide pyruvyl transferase family protein [Salinivibrio sp. KP-1]KKA44116.1 hypothetical protein WN56_12935 [Salinivibrio sp. KP-1]